MKPIHRLDQTRPTVVTRLRLPGLVLGTVLLGGCSTVSGWFDRDNDATAPAALTELKRSRPRSRMRGARQSPCLPT